MLPEVTPLPLPSDQQVETLYRDLLNPLIDQAISVLANTTTTVVFGVVAIIFSVLLAFMPVAVLLYRSSPPETQARRMQQMEQGVIKLERQAASTPDDYKDDIAAYVARRGYEMFKERVKQDEDFDRGAAFEPDDDSPRGYRFGAVGKYEVSNPPGTKVIWGTLPSKGDAE
ncbi:MAG: hypothetical protein SF029_26035 [bacterium]|nr:hypothetical protein [bacterium]